MRKVFELLSIVVIAFLFVSGDAEAQWRTSTSSDEMTGKKSCFAISQSTGPKEKMGFPYGDVKAWIGVGSDGTREWAFVGFNNQPNLVDTDIGDGFEEIRTRIKWDDQVENVTLIQTFGAKFLHFENDKTVIEKIANSGTVLLELPWYDEGGTYFRFSLSGSSAAIEKARKACTVD